MLRHLLVGRNGNKCCRSFTFAKGTNSRTFKILGVQQVAIGATDINLLRDFWIGALGISKIGEYKSEVKIISITKLSLSLRYTQKENVIEDILEVGTRNGKIEIDLMQPIDPNKSPKVHIPALNHIGLWVDSLENAHTELIAKGIIFTPGGIRKGAST